MTQTTRGFARDSDNRGLQGLDRPAQQLEAGCASVSSTRAGAWAVHTRRRRTSDHNPGRHGAVHAGQVLLDEAARAGPRLVWAAWN